MCILQAEVQLGQRKKHCFSQDLPALLGGYRKKVW